MGPDQDVGSGPAAIGHVLDVGNVTESMDDSSLFQRLGGEAKLREIVDTFIDRVFADPMIGFFFRHADRARIKEMEFQLAAEFLGAEIKYSGQPLDKVHAKHPIMGGQFARRRQIFKETLEFFEVQDEIKSALLNHTDRLRPLITPESGSDCDPVGARSRVNSR